MTSCELGSNSKDKDRGEDVEGIFLFPSGGVGKDSSRVTPSALTGVRAASGTGAMWAAFLAVLLASLMGCSARYYRERADRVAYGIVAEKQEKALGGRRPFSIETAEPSFREALELREATDSAQGLLELTINDALRIAAQNNRDYQSRKEQVYLAALTLSGERHLWRPQLVWTISAAISRSGGETTATEAASNFSLSQLLLSAARLAVNLSSSFLRIVSIPTSTDSSSEFSASIIQPILSGAGSRVARESLTQAERNVVYEVRSFARFQKQFAVQVASDYYRVLQRQDTMDNEWSNYQSLVRSRERTEALAQAGRLPSFQIDQASQDELRAKNRWISAKEQYEGALDQFRITLGAPPDAPVTLDEEELERLKAVGVSVPAMPLDDAVKTALVGRLDLMNATDTVADSMRKVAIAADALRAELNITASARAGTSPLKPVAFEFDEGTYELAMAADVPLDRVRERNDYRASLISLERQHRALEQLEDSIRLQVRQAHRRLVEAAQSYEIQESSLALALRRVESTGMLQQAGRAETRDVLEATQALVESQNALTAALANFRVASLEFQRDTELLEVDEAGLLVEEKD